MFPLRDENPTRITPFITLLLIGINLLVYFGFQLTADDPEFLLYERAAIACEITTGAPLSVAEKEGRNCEEGAQQPAYVPGKNIYLAILVSMFLHGSIPHVFFNMWFLWIFGNNVEEAYGHVLYLGMYLLGGIVATMSFVLFNSQSTIPLVGASGAIAAALGSYAVLFPGHRVVSILFYFVARVPAAIFLVAWLVLQFFVQEESVANEAHIGGFVFGALLTLIFRRRLLSRV